MAMTSLQGGSDGQRAQPHTLLLRLDNNIPLNETGSGNSVSLTAEMHEMVEQCIDRRWLCGKGE
jgi:hypothetical protein